MFIPNVPRVLLRVLPIFELTCELNLDTLVERIRSDKRHVNRAQLHHPGREANKRAHVA